MIRRLSRTHLRRSLPAALALVLAAVLAPGLAAAHDDHDHGDQDRSADCPPALMKELRSAADRFAAGCSLPGEDIAKLDDSGAVVPPGGQASKNMALIANIPKQGAFAGEGSFNSDIAFKGRYAYAGNYDGFMVYDIKKPSQPEVVAQVVCPGSQNDISIWKNLLILSVDSSRSDDSCASTTQPATEKESWEGVRVFDISDPASPQYIAAVETPCGSHTHTLAPDQSQRNLYVYVSSYSPNATFPDCQPPHDAISIVKIPRSAPEGAFLASTPVLFPDGGNPGGTGYSATTGCHDITAYPSRDIAAGACMGDGVLIDIADREHPVVTEQVRDTTNFAFWHSATFNNSGRKVVFTDELGGGGAPDVQQHDRAEARRGRHLRHRRRPAGVPQLLQDAPRPVEHRELRGPQRLADPGQGQGHHGPGVVPGRDLGLRLHQLEQAEGAGLVRPRAAVRGRRSCSAGRGRRTGTTATSTPTTSRRAWTSWRCVTRR